MPSCLNVSISTQSPRWLPRWKTFRGRRTHIDGVGNLGLALDGVLVKYRKQNAESRRVKYRNRLQKCWSISVNYRAKQKSFSACFWPCGLRAAEQLCCVFKLSGTVYCHYCSPDNWIFCSTFWHYILSEEVALCVHVQHVNLDEVLYLRCYKYSISNVMLVNANLYL